MELVSLLLIAAVAVVAVVAVYTLTMLYNWIRDRIATLRNRQILTGAVKARLRNGNYKVVPFIFDKRHEQFVDAEAFEAEELGEDLLKEFGTKDILVYKT